MDDGLVAFLSFDQGQLFWSVENGRSELVHSLVEGWSQGHARQLLICLFFRCFMCFTDHSGKFIAACWEAHFPRQGKETNDQLPFVYQSDQILSLGCHHGY